MMTKKEYVLIRYINGWLNASKTILSLFDKKKNKAGNFLKEL